MWLEGHKQISVFGLQEFLVFPNMESNEECVISKSSIRTELEL